MNLPNQNQPLLPPQREAYDAVLEKLRSNRTVVIRGMKGVGKSRLLETLHANKDSQTLLLDGVNANIDEIEPAAEIMGANSILLCDTAGHMADIGTHAEKLRRDYRTILTANADRALPHQEGSLAWNDTEYLDSQCDGGRTPYEVVDIRPLSLEEAATFSRKLRPDISEETARKIALSSLGIPLVIARTCDKERIDFTQFTRLITAIYLIVHFWPFCALKKEEIEKNSVYETALLIPSLKWVQDGCEAMLELAESRLGEKIPPAIVALIPEVIRVWNLTERGDIRPTAILPPATWLAPHSVFCHTPRSEGFENTYQVLGPCGTNIRIFAPHCPPAISRELFGKLDIDSTSFPSRSRLHTFGVENFQHKDLAGVEHAGIKVVTPDIVAAYKAQKGSGTDEWFDDIRQKLRAVFNHKSLESVNTWNKDACAFLFPHKRGNPANKQAGLAIESYLQGENVSYYVDHGFMEHDNYSAFYYDGKSGKYNQLGKYNTHSRNIKW